MSDEIKRSVNPPPPAIVPSPPPAGGETSPADSAVAALFGALNIGVAPDVSGAYEKYADREAHIGEEI